MKRLLCGMVLDVIRLTVFLLLLLTLRISFAQESNFTDAELKKQIAEIEKEIQNELMMEDSPWDFSSNIRLGGGYKENVTMSAFSQESSEFSMTGLDFIAVRLPMDDDAFELAIFGAFDDRRYFDAPSVDVEQTGLFNAALEKSIGDNWLIKTDFRLVYIDEVFDASYDYKTIGTIQVVGRQVSLEPALRRKLIGDSWFEIQPNISRQYFAEPLDDYLEIGGHISIGVDYGFQSEFQFYYNHIKRKYDDRMTTTLTGEKYDLSNENDEFLVEFYGVPRSLIYNRPERGIEWTHYWDNERRLRMRTRFSVLENTDNGPSDSLDSDATYYGYRRERISHSWRYRLSPYSISATINNSSYCYDVQRSFNENNTFRQRVDRSFDISIQYAQTENLKLQFGFEQEITQSNVRQDEYRYRIYSVGLDWEF